MTIFRTTEYRKRVLQLLAETPNLKHRHFYELLDSTRDPAHPGWQRQVRRILKLLSQGDFSKRYVGVTYAVDPDKSESLGHPYGENIYWLTQVGRDHARTLGAITEAQAKRAKFYKTRSRTTALHSADIGETTLTFEKWCAGVGRKLYHRVTDLTMDFAGTTLVADLLLQIANPEQKGANTFNFIVEVEDTKQNDYESGRSGVIRKCAFYVRYFRTRDCIARFGFGDFRVLIIVKTERYARSLLGVLEKLMLDGKFEYTDASGTARQLMKPTRLLWIVTQDELRLHAGEPIFRTPADYETRRYSLAEIL